MAFTYGDSNFDSVFGAGDPTSMSPALGRLLAQNPESIIPQLVALGVEPPQGPLPTYEGATPTESIPPSEPLPPGSTPGMPQLSTPAKPNYGEMQPKIDAAKNFFGGLLSPAASAPPPQMAPGANAPADWYDVPLLAPSATAGQAPAASPSLSEATGAGGGVPTPRADPRKAAGGTTEASAKGAGKGLLDALSGIKAPPAPPTPVLRPETGRGGAFPQNSPIAALLAAFMAGGKAEQPNVLRLGQAIGPK